jgi:acyl-CoA thioester hydrolase
MLAEHATEIIVRYAETDQMGSVHHSSYLIYMEAARVWHLDAMGLPYHEMEARGIFLPVIDLSVRYHRPAKFGQRLCVVSRMHPLSGIRLKVDYSLYQGDSLVAEGHTLHAFVGREGRPMRPPKDIIRLLS